MANSPLAFYIDRTSGNYNSRTSLITKISIHNACTVGTCEDLSKIIASCPSASFNYGIATDGTVGLYVDERYRAWATGNPEADHSSVSICVCNSSLAPDYKISNETYQSLIKLCVDICRRNFITKLTYTNSARTSTLLRHDWFASVNCPGPYLSSIFSRIASEVSTKLSQPMLAENETEALKSQSSIIVDSINPYLVTLSEDTTYVDMSKFKLASIVGVMMYGGSYYTGSGLVKTKRDRYINPNLKALTAEADKQRLPYALYATSYARNIQEAVLECEQLFYVISKYPPKLGIWLHPVFGTTTVTNDAIVSKYYDYFVRWGLKDKCGIYCSKNEVSKITWKNFSDKFSLWTIDSVESTDKLDELLTPRFFKL